MLVILLLVMMVLSRESVAVTSLNQQQVSLGHSKYRELTQSSSQPRYGPCWLAALGQLETKCEQLTEESHSRLALQFANCQLLQSGQKSLPCEASERVSSCLERVDTNAWTSYTSFYTHTHNMCYFLKSQQWQENTDITIDKLSQTSSMAVEKLEESQQLQQEIASGQRDSLEYQRQLAENGTFLSQAIEASRGSVQEMMDEFKLSTREQRNMIFEVFDRVSKLQNLVVSEVSWLYTVVFYCSSLLVIYLLTATKRTADARLWLFLLLTINFGLERAVIKMSLPSEHESSSRTTSADMKLGEMVSERVWMVRNITALIGFFTLTVMAFRFKDYHLINHQLLEEIRRQNVDLKMSMEQQQVENRNKYNMSKRPWVDSLDGHGQPQVLSPDIQALLSEDTGYRGDEEEDEYSDGDDSFETTRSDRTCEPEDVSIGEGSRETTPTPQIDINLAMEEINSSLVSSTPLKRTSKASRRPSEIYRDYNLRSKSRASTSSVISNLSFLESPVVQCPQSSLVKKAASTQKRNMRKIKQLQTQHEYSADES